MRLSPGQSAGAIDRPLSLQYLISARPQSIVVFIMRKLAVFNHVTLDGYFVDATGEMSWAKADPQDAEWNAL
jgi:hypothetical protein